MYPALFFQKASVCACVRAFVRLSLLACISLLLFLIIEPLLEPDSPHSRIRDGEVVCCFGLGIDVVIDLSVGAEIAVGIMSGNPRKDGGLRRRHLGNVRRVVAGKDGKTFLAQIFYGILAQWHTNESC